MKTQNASHRRQEATEARAPGTEAELSAQGSAQQTPGTEAEWAGGTSPSTALPDTTGPHTPVTLRSLGFTQCGEVDAQGQEQHPLLIGTSVHNINRCPYCGARLVDGRYVGGSIDYPMRRPVDLAARAARELMKAAGVWSGSE